MKVNNILKKLSLAAIGVALVSCSNDYLHNDELEDQVYLINTGLTAASVYNWGTYTYKLAVIKSGRGNKNASLKIVVDENALADYNATNGTSLELMPSECYSLKESSLDFSKDDYRKYFLIDFQPDVIQSLSAANSGVEYVLPVRLKINDNSISLAEDADDVVLLKPAVSEPYISFTSPGFFKGGASFSISTDNDDITVVYPKVSVNFPNEWDITYTVDVDATILDEYNTQNGTTYKMIPDAAYEIDKSSLVMRNNFTTEMMKLSLKEEGFMRDADNYNFGYYAVPLRITSVSKYGIDPESSTLIYPVTLIAPDVDKSSWAVDSVSCQVSDEIDNSTSTDFATLVYDTKTDTYWRTKWVTPDPLPYLVSIDMGELNKIYGVSFALPDNKNYGNIKSGYFEISEDNQTWKKIVEFTRTDEATDRKMSFDIDMVKGRYLRFVITDAFEYADPAVGKASGARCALAEIYASGY
jgi:hypothetical protein